MLDLRKISSMCRAKNVIERTRTCEQGHKFTTREFLYRPRPKGDRHSHHQVDRCQQCGARAPIKNTHSASYSNRRFTVKSVGIYEQFGAMMRVRECPECGERFFTYEVEYPVKKRLFPIQYCETPGCGCTTKAKYRRL